MSLSNGAGKPFYLTELDLSILNLGLKHMLQMAQMKGEYEAETQVLVLMTKLGLVRVH